MEDTTEEIDAKFKTEAKEEIISPIFEFGVKIENIVPTIKKEDEEYLEPIVAVFEKKLYPAKFDCDTKPIVLLKRLDDTIDEDVLSLKEKKTVDIKKGEPLLFGVEKTNEEDPEDNFEITTEDEGGMEEMDGENIDCIVSIEAGDSPEAKNQLDCTVEILEGCDEAFENQEDLLEHKKQVNENQSKIKGPKHSCRVCGLEFKYKANWLKHEKLHDDIYHFKCKHCDITFKQRMALKSHYMYVHATEKPYQCEFCERAFKTLNNLNVHKEVHHNFSGETFSCDFCPMEFKRRCYLRRHLRTHANPDKKYTCADCGLKCRSKTDIAKHVLTHLGVVEKHFFCEICGAGFSKRAHVTRHSYTHSVEKSFACQLCDKAYRDQYSLKIHNETVHLGIIYTCELCGFKSDRYAVKKHMKRCAEGQKKFTCNVCSKEYFLKKYFEQHVSKCNSKS